MTISMTRNLFILLFSALILASCSPSAAKKAAEIEKLENELKESGRKNVTDKAKANELMDDYRYYVNKFPDDSLTPVYLMMEGKFYEFNSQPDSAINCYSQVYNRFPAYPHAYKALFNEAYIFNNEKHDLPMAKALFEEYLKKYPNTHLAKDVRNELRYLGKTPDQIMAELDSLKKIHRDAASKKP